MSFDADRTQRAGGPTGLTFEDLIAIQPRYLRGKLSPGARGPGGERPGRGRSQTLDFDGLGPYVPGDDVRTIDWRASLRSQQTIVRRFAAASHRARVLILDLKPELFFGTEDRIMAKSAALTAAWLAWMSLSLHEPIGLLCGGQTFAPRRGRRHVLRLLEAIQTAFHRDSLFDPSGLETAAHLTGQRDEICLITDLPADPQELCDAGRALAGSRVLKLYLVQDPMVTRPLEAGRYPARGPDGVRRVITVRGGVPVDQDSERLLLDAGWRIERVLDLLPRRAVA